LLSLCAVDTLEVESRTVTFRGWGLAGVQASALLGSFLSEHEDRVVKRASKLLRHELDASLSREHRRQAAPAYTGELAALLLERGFDAPRLWGEAVRHHGGAHFEARYDIADLIREFRALESAIVEEWHRRVGPMPEDVALLLSECTAEGAAAAASDFVRHARGARVQFREEALIETILEHLDEGILLVEADGTFSFATRPAEQLLGPRIHDALNRPLADEAMAGSLEAIGASCAEGEPLRPEDLPAATTLRTGLRAGPLRLRVRSDAGERVLEAAALPIFQEDLPEVGGRRPLRGVIMTLRDRTVEVTRAEELARANRELAELQTRLLHRTRAQAMGELATGAAHALNNLLNSMHLRLRLLREKVGAEQTEALGRSVNDIAGMVARLQQFAGQRPAGPVQVCSLDAAVREALALVRPEGLRAGEGPLHLHVDLRNPPGARANASELREVLVSLLIEARDYLAGGGELSVQTLASAGGPQCLLSVSPPGGKALRPETWEEPLLQPEAPASLALAASTAGGALRRWGGTLQIRAGPAGSAELALSFASGEVAAESAVRQEPAKSSGAKRVLVIDDDPDNATMLAEVLAAEGHEADTANTGREALAKWAQGRFEVALVDLLMPDMPGTEIATALIAERPTARVALVTGWDLDPEQVRAAKVHALFRKPVDLSRLLQFLAPGGQLEAPQGEART
jgi:two-component system cell cycle sensor histidine kinase/response regulator CckA